MTTRKHPWLRTSLYLAAKPADALEFLRRDWAYRYANGEVSERDYPFARLVAEVVEEEAGLVGWVWEDTPPDER
jgi:hypothetical protein